MIIQLIFVLVLVGIFSSYYVRKWKQRKSSPPGPWGLPIIGNLHILLRGTRPHEALTDLRSTYGSIVSVQLGNLQTVVLNDTKVIKEACSLPAFEGRTDMSFFRLVTGGQVKGLMFNEGRHGMEQRNFVVRHLRAFSQNRESREALILKDVSELLEGIEKARSSVTKVNNGCSVTTRKIPVQMKFRFSVPVLNSLWTALMGTRQNHEDPSLKRLIELGEAATANYGSLTLLALFFPWFGKRFPKFSGATKVMDAHMEALDIVRGNMDLRNETRVPGQPRSITDAYLDKVEGTTDPNSSFHPKAKNAAFTIAELVGPGFEAGSSTLEWITIYLSQNRTVQKKLQNEIDHILGTGENQRPPSLTDQSGMVYAMAVINEILRITTVTPLSIWHRAVEDVVFRGYRIPKDTVIIPNLHGANRDPNVWGMDADLFRPERFIENDGHLLTNGGDGYGQDMGLAKDWVVTFGVGRRACVGEALARDQLFLFMVSIFQKFDVSCGPVEPSMEPHVGVVLSPKPFELLFQARKSVRDDRSLG